MIKNLVFDMGDVLLSYRWMQIMYDHGLSEEETNEFWDKFFKDGNWVYYDNGTYNTKEFEKFMSEKYPEQAENIHYLLTNLDKMPVSRQEVWDKVTRLKKEKGYNLYILSNYPQEMFESHTARVTCMKDMDGVVVSGAIHLTKPNKDIYEYLLNTYNLDPAETIFFDDRIDNIEGAKAAGIDGVVIESEEFLLGLLDDYLK
ncbi:MAG: HAD family phosphatase [Lachnospiraceae bacterium]|nr:HAD family phosphatase [Lachnospiraceae bacterium]